MTEIIQSNLKYFAQTLMNNIEQYNPDLLDSFLLTCKVTSVTTYVKLKISNYWRTVAENQRIFNFRLLI